MTDRPILFSGPMVRALLDGRKTMTRRILKLPKKTYSGGPIYERPDMGGWAATTIGGGGCFSIGKGGERIPEPESVGIWHQTTGVCMSAPWQPGDRLWVRETWQALSFGDYLPTMNPQSDVRYAATDPLADADKGVRGYPWRVSIHMPRWASRITLHVTAVKVERLSAISEADAKAEGCRPADPATGREVLFDDGMGSYRLHFESLWESLHGPGSWEANPWVAAISFTAIKANIDSAEARAA